MRYGIATGTSGSCGPEGLVVFSSGRKTAITRSAVNNIHQHPFASPGDRYPATPGNFNGIVSSKALSGNIHVYQVITVATVKLPFAQFLLNLVKRYLCPGIATSGIEYLCYVIVVITVYYLIPVNP